MGVFNNFWHDMGSFIDHEASNIYHGAVQAEQAIEKGVGKIVSNKNVQNFAKQAEREVAKDINFVKSEIPKLGHFAEDKVLPVLKTGAKKVESAVETVGKGAFDEVKGTFKGINTIGNDIVSGVTSITQILPYAIIGLGALYVIKN